MPDVGRYIHRKVDKSGEGSNFDVFCYVSPTGAEWDINRVKMVTLGDALNAITQGATKSTRRIGSEIYDPNLYTGLDGERELKYKVVYERNSDGKRYYATIPCAVSDYVTYIPNTQLIDLTAGDFPAFVAAFNDIVTDKDGTNMPCSVVQMTIEGRNI